MASSNRVVLDLGISASDLENRLRLDAEDPQPGLRRLSDFLRALAGGFGTGTVRLNTGAVKAVGTLTFTDNPSADETFTLANVVFTGKASGASGNAEWNITSGGSAGADAAGNATSVAALVNAHPTTSAIVVATVNAGVVTFTAVAPGLAGNGVQISDTLTNGTAGAFAGGTDGTTTVLSLL